MLSDRERNILHEMQRQFVTEDPGFARSFEELGRRGDSRYSSQWAYGMPRWVYTQAFVVSVALSVLMLLALAPWTALVFMTLAIMIAIARFHWDDEARQVPTPRSRGNHPTSGHTPQARPDHGP